MSVVKRTMKRLHASKDLYHFKLLVLFVFLVYGFVLPLWFVLHGHRFLNASERWVDVVISSSRVSRSKHVERKQTDGENNHKNANDYGKNKTNPRKLTKTVKSFESRISSISKKSSSNNGPLISMRWNHLCCQSVNCLRKYPLFPLLPSNVNFLRNLSVSNSGKLYGQRVLGLLSPPKSGMYSFWVKCVATCELWLSEGKYLPSSKLFMKVVHGLPVNISKHQHSSDIELSSRTSYFIDIVFVVYRLLDSYPLEVFWKLPNAGEYTLITQDLFVDLSKNFKSLSIALKLLSGTPSVHLTPFLEAIEEQGEDDEDFEKIGDEPEGKDTFRNQRGMVVPFNASLHLAGSLSLLKRTFNTPVGRRLFKSCDHKPSYLVYSSFPKYGGVWKTSFSSVFPSDKTGRMMCIGNRYPVDCRGNKRISHKTIQKLLTLYTDALSKRNVFDAKEGNKMPPERDTGLRVRSLVNIEEKKDPLKGSRFFLEAVLTDVRSNITFFHSEYVYMHKDNISLCSPRGFIIDLYTTVFVVVVAKRQSRWLRHFLVNMERIYIDTNDKHLKIIIAKYGKDDGNLKEEYKRSRLPSIRTVRQFGKFHKTKAIQSAVDTIQDENSIIFLVDLHILIPNSMISLVRKHTIKGKMVFNPVLFRLAPCGSPASSKKPSQGFWETFGYGIVGIYKSDWDRIGGMSSKMYTAGWGGEDWELLDRILSAGLEVERLRVPNFYHFYHSKKNMWD